MYIVGMSQADYERLEVDRADDRSIIESQQTRIITLEQRIIQQSVTLETHDTKIEELESGEATVNYTAGIIQLEAYIDELNSTLANFIGKLYI